MLPILLLALNATPSLPAESAVADDFGIEVVEQVRTARGLRLGLSIANRTGASRLFVHLEPNESDAKTVLFMPSAQRDRTTYYVKSDGSETYRATLMFPLEPAATSAVVVVGEAVAPYRQAGRTLILNQPIAPPEPPAPTPPPEPEAKPGERIMARYQPPVSALGEVVLRDGSGGSDGKGWTRVYTDLPDVSLDQVALAIRKPNQIWSGSGGLLFIAKIGLTRAIALEVRDGEIVTARLITKESFPRAVGPGTSFPSRIYVGK
ncbi:MAG TPA: hypothetical protein V6D05_13990 [Stenomitos sp.]